VLTVRGRWLVFDTEASDHTHC